VEAFFYMAKHDSDDPQNANNGNIQFTVQDLTSARNRPAIALKLRSARPSISAFFRLATFPNIWLLVAFITSFWQWGYDHFGAQPRSLMLFGVAIWVFTMIYVLVFTIRWFLKPLLIANVLPAAGASYYHGTMTSPPFASRNPRRV